MKILCSIGLKTGAILAILSSAGASAGPVDLSTWTAESYPAVQNFNAGVWNVAGDGSSVFQSVNGQPTMFYSDFSAQGSAITGSINVNAAGGDDDFIGFVLGFNPGDSTSSSADYLLVDWKAGSQSFNFGSPSNSSGGLAPKGLAVSRVTGIPDADEFWQHDNLAGTPAGSNVVELARGNTLGTTGWAASTTYSFTFDFGPNDLKVFVDSILELQIAGSFSDGRLGFYNFSQAGVTYSGFEKEQGSFPPPTASDVPTPATLALFGIGLAGLGWSKRKKQA